MWRALVEEGFGCGQPWLKMVTVDEGPSWGWPWLRRAMLRIALVDEAPLKVKMIKVCLYCRFYFYLIKTICALLIKCTFKYFATSWVIVWQFFLKIAEFVCVVTFSLGGYNYTAILYVSVYKYWHLIHNQMFHNSMYHENVAVALFLNSL